MPLQLIDNVGALGLISDTDVRKQRDGAWSDGQNVRFDGFVATKVRGSRTIHGSLSAAPYSLFAHTTFDGSQFFAYAGINRVFTVNNNTHYELTRVSNTSTAVLYNTDSTALWTGGVLGGLLFMNNGIDVPQIQRTPTASCRLSNLPNWPTTITTRASALRAFRNYLVALDVTKGALRFRQMVKWSASADPLAVPSTWNEGDPTADAGETSLADTNGNVIDCLPLRDVNIVYKDDSIYGMQYIGGAFIFRFYQIFSSVGLLAKRCVAAFEQFHCFVGSDLDVYVHDGNSIKSIGQDRWREWLRQNTDGTNYERMFLVANPVTTEIWICVPIAMQPYTSRVLMWNWRKDTWGSRDVANVSAGAVGGIESSDYLTTWAQLQTSGITWDTWGVTWSELDSLPPDKKLVLISPTNTTGLIETEYGSTELGAAMPFSIERQGMWSMPCKVVDGARVADLQTVKFIRRIRFRTDSFASAVNVNFSVAIQSDVDSPLTWVSTSKVTDRTVEITVFKRGRFVSVRCSSTLDTLFSLEEVEVEYDVSGSYL